MYKRQLVDSAFVMVPWLVAQGRSAGLKDVVAGTRRLIADHPINAWVADGAGEPLASVDPLRSLAARSDASGDGDDFLLNLGALMSAAQMLGLADAMLAQAVEYAKVRTQFGQPVGAFQGLKHQLANCSVAIEFAKPVVWRAAQAMEDGMASAGTHVSHAKLAATDAATLTAETAIQVHGAMGYTYEVDLHFWMKRTWALCGAWGARAFHYNRVEQAVLSGIQPTGPQHTFA